MVLGFQWLENLGNIQWDFKNLSMEFGYQGKTHVLRGCAQGQLQSISSKSLDKILTQCSDVRFCYLAVKDEQQLQLHSLDCSGSNMIVDDAVALFLEGHEVVFNEPTSLPPFGDHNHQILLKEDTQDIASRSYRHTSVQKDVIEKDALSSVHTSDIVISLGRRKGGSMLQDSFEVLEVGCSKLGQRRLFFQLVDAILKLGNRRNGEIESAPHKIEEPKHRTERVFRVLKGMFQRFALGNIQIFNLEGKVDLGWDDLIREKE